MIEELKKLIENEDVANFKKVFEKATINAHHRELLYEITFRKQSLELSEYMGNKVFLDNEGKMDIFFKTLNDGVHIKDFKYVEQLEDIILAKKLKDHTQALVRSQGDEFLIKFMEAKPLTTFMNFRRMMYFSFEYDRTHFIKHVMSQNLDKDSVFYFCLCTIKFNSKEMLSNFLMDAVIKNPNIFNEMKVLKDDYLKRMKLKFGFQQKEREVVDSFVNEVVVETFANYLEIELQRCKPLDASSAKPKRTKI